MKRTTKARNDENTKGTDMGHEFEALSGKILEAAVAVHKELGPGFLSKRIVLYHCLVFS